MTTLSPVSPAATRSSRRKRSRRITLKKDLEKLQQETEELKKKEADVKDLINRHKLQMSIVEKEGIKGLEEIEIRQENEEN